MTDAPADELGDIDPNNMAAIAANERNSSSKRKIWLDHQSIRHWLVELGFYDEAEQALIIGAWSAVGRAARLARGRNSSKLAAINFGTHSPPAVSGQPPTISAADFAMVIRSKEQLAHARDRQRAALSSEAVQASAMFIDRMEAYLHV